MDCNVKKNTVQCTCTYEPCPRKGKCCECVIYHRRSGEIPGCFFSRDAEATYDRSVGNFARISTRR
ncbi:MAG: hypothetical protein HY897_12385 [Deltaproteobacteria bacterium]|nr:hypothetical protein [Deltaproteobacteria bacterium]